MRKIYIFDVDGTLTPSRQKMTDEFKKFFDEWSKRNPLYGINITNDISYDTDEDITKHYKDKISQLKVGDYLVIGLSDDADSNFKYGEDEYDLPTPKFSDKSAID